MFQQIIRGSALCAAFVLVGLSLAEAKPALTHYIEFRSAVMGAYGHTYAVYGSLDANGKPSNTHYADLHPMGGYGMMAVGHIVPVPANTEWDPQVASLPVASSYRRNLTTAEYRKLLDAIQHARANKKPLWHIVFNNCNHFIAELAIAIGMHVPPDLQLSYSFIPTLSLLNGSTTPAAFHSANRS
jgi:hypothetical protein